MNVRKKYYLTTLINQINGIIKLEANTIFLEKDILNELRHVLPIYEL